MFEVGQYQQVSQPRNMWSQVGVKKPILSVKKQSFKYVKYFKM